MTKKRLCFLLILLIINNLLIINKIKKINKLIINKFINKLLLINYIINKLLLISLLIINLLILFLCLNSMQSFFLRILIIFAIINSNIMILQFHNFYPFLYDNLVYMKIPMFIFFGANYTN